MRKWLAAAAVALLAVPARGALVIFTDGRYAKCAGYRVEGGELEVRLPGGGGYTTSLLTVDRIIDDEVPPAPAAVTALAASLPARADLTFHPGKALDAPSPYARLILAECRRGNVDAGFVAALIRAESGFDPYAISRKGARGLMQLMPSTARRLGVRRLFDPAANIRGGVAYLHELIERYDSRPDLVLAAYNAGESAVAEYSGVPPYRETVEYVRRVLAWWKPEARVARVEWADGDEPGE